MSRASIESSTPSSRDSTWNGKPAPSTYLHKQLDVTLGDGLVELIQGVINALAGALRQVKASSYIELVGLGVFGRLLLLFTTRLQPELAGSIGSHVVFYRSDIGGCALILLTPDVRALA